VDVIGVRSLRRQAAGLAQAAVPMARPEASGEGLAARRLAFERLTDQRLLRAYRLATLVMRDSSEAQDAVHDAAVLAWTRFDELRDRTLFDAWFDRIVVNTCRQRLRQRRVRPLVVEAAPEVALGDRASGWAERGALRRYALRELRAAYEAAERGTEAHR